MKGLTYKIIKESIFILLIASAISSVGGFGLTSIEEKLVNIIAVLVMFPALNNLVGGFGTIISSKFTTILFLRGISKKWWRSKELQKLFRMIIIVAFTSAIYLGFISIIISGDYEFVLFLKVMFIAVFSILFVTCIMFLVSVMGGLYVYKRNHDPDNYLIPLTTSIADLLSMLTLSVLVFLLF